MSRDRKEEEGPHPVAVGIAIGIWISVMLFIALIVVPLLFGRCTPPAPS